MVAKQIQMFGGDWTEEKLEMLRKYLAAYTKALKDQPFDLKYIDAFAGTGYRELKIENSSQLLFPELADEEAQNFLKGSAGISLEISPPFDEYIFIEKSPQRYAELLKLKDRYPKLADRIRCENKECNIFIQHLCRKIDWSENRAVLFLDPFGMQVKWETMQAIASTGAIDVWILFPLGVGVNRLLKRDGNIPSGWRTRLDMVFGTTDWYKRFYQELKRQGLFEEVREVKKTGDFQSISDYYMERLQTIFASVVGKPKTFCNSKGNPLFQLHFAVGNPKPAAIKIAMRIAEYILEN